MQGYNDAGIIRYRKGHLIWPFNFRSSITLGISNYLIYISALWSINNISLQLWFETCVENSEKMFNKVVFRCVRCTLLYNEVQSLFEFKFKLSLNKSSFVISHHASDTPCSFLKISTLARKNMTPNFLYHSHNPVLKSFFVPDDLANSPLFLKVHWEIFLSPNYLCKFHKPQDS